MPKRKRTEKSLNLDDEADDVNLGIAMNSHEHLEGKANTCSLLAVIMSITVEPELLFGSDLKTNYFKFVSTAQTRTCES